MSDLYHETTEVRDPEPDTSQEPAPDNSPRQQYETTEQADRGYDDYTESQAEVEARIADQDELPTPAESRQATWGDNPDYYDEADLDTAYDNDADAFLAEQDELATPQESRAQTWGDSPEYDDEPDPAPEHDQNLDAATPQEDDPAVQQAPESPDPADSRAEPAVSQEDAPENHAQDTDSASHHQDPAAATDENPDPAGSNLAAAETNPDLSSEQHQPSADAEATPDLKQLTEENAELKQRLTAMEARFERINDLEERLGILERSESDRSSANEADQLQAVDDRTQPEENSKAKAERVEQPRSGWSNEAVGFAAALSGGALTVAGDFMSAVPAEVAGGVGSAVAVGASAVSWWRKHKEVKDANRS